MTDGFATLSVTLIWLLRKIQFCISFYNCNSYSVLYNVVKRGTLMKQLEVVCGIIRQEHQVLIARRGKGVHENMWEFPGGKVEPGETKEAALVRELKEELDVDVKVDFFLQDVMDVREDLCIHVSAYVCTLRKGIPTLHVHHEWKWVDKATLNLYSFEPADQCIIERVIGEVL